MVNSAEAEHIDIKLTLAQICDTLSDNGDEEIPRFSSGSILRNDCQRACIRGKMQAERVMEIDMKKALKPFMRRLAAEAALRSAIAAALIVLPAWLVLMGAYRVFGVGECALSYMPAAFVLAACGFYGFLYRPTKRKLAKRLDEAGELEDRVSTMVEFERREGVFYAMQREEAAGRLAQCSPRLLRIRFSRPAAAACVLLALLTGVVAWIPQEIVARLPFARETESEEAVMLREKISSLRAAIEESDIGEEDQRALLTQVDELLEQLNLGRMDIAALKQISEMMKGMEKTVEDLTPRDTYAAALMEFESLSALGEAIFDENIDVVNLVFDSMAYQLHGKEGMEQVNALMNLVYDIQASLAKPIRDTSQETLRQGMMMLAGGLESAAEMAYGKRDNTLMIDTAIDGAKIYVREFLGVSGEEERYDPYANKSWAEEGAVEVSLAPAASVKTEQTTLSPAQTVYVYDPPQAVLLSSYQPGEMDEAGNIQRIIAPKDERLDGTVPYGSVYGAYYARYLEEAASGVFPADIEQEIKAYFDGI